MAKPIIRYKPVATPDKVHHKMNYIPTIVDREDKIGLDQIIIRAIDHGRIVGVKAEAAAGLANGIAAQTISEFKRHKVIPRHIIPKPPLPRNAAPAKTGGAQFVK